MLERKLARAWGMADAKVLRESIMTTAPEERERLADGRAIWRAVGTHTRDASDVRSGSRIARWVMRLKLFADALKVFAGGLDHDIYVTRLLDSGE